MKLSCRLQHIADMVASDYEQIWDCCCDHGLLGAALLDDHPDTCIHFVDIVPSLMQQVESKLQRFYPIANWQVHCLDVAQLPLADYSGNQLIIIAGVGGDLLIEFIHALSVNHPQLELDFIFCPVHHQYALRQQLIKLNFGLKQEVLIEENQRCYEVLYVCHPIKNNAAISSVGEQIWQAHSSQQAQAAQNHLHKTLQHYQRMQQGHNNANVQQIINHYQLVNITVEKS